MVKPVSLLWAQNVARIVKQRMLTEFFGHLFGNVDLRRTYVDGRIILK
jgi:hypothetical protein